MSVVDRHKAIQLSNGELACNNTLPRWQKNTMEDDVDYDDIGGDDEDFEVNGQSMDAQ